MQENLNFISKNIELSAYLFTILQQANVPVEQLRSVLGAFSRTSIEYELFTTVLAELPASLLLADEWFYHRFYTLFATCTLYPSPAQLNQFIDLVPTTDSIIFIATPPELCLKRMQQRQDIPQYLLRYSPTEVEGILTKYHQLFELLFSSLKERGLSITKYDGISEQVDNLVSFCTDVIGK
jgi:hypothetical protein